MTGKLRRRLTTVLSADVEGYARLMESDEAGTLDTLRRYRTAMAKMIERHDGRVINTWGDAVIAEFASVVEAVQCAVETQQELSGHNDALPEARRMRFRIGINLGDVMVEGDDVYGDGVNIAARLQQLAEPGGIMISGPVYDQVHDKLSISFDRLGDQHVKNVAKPIMSYRVVQGDATARGAKPLSGETTRLGASERSSGRPRTILSHIRHWCVTLPRPIAVILALIGFLLLLNIFSGLDDIWFHWPAAPLLLIVVLWSIFRRKPS
jgi:adenylate cyclase